jgi:hypothetical protein
MDDPGGGSSNADSCFAIQAGSSIWWMKTPAFQVFLVRQRSIVDGQQGGDGEKAR